MNSEMLEEVNLTVDDLYDLYDLLTDYQYQVYTMSENGHKNIEIAEMLNKTYESVKSTLRDARRKVNLAQSKGVVDQSRKMGLDLNHVHSGWIKTEEASLYFMNPKNEITPEDFTEVIKGAFASGFAKTPSKIFNIQPTDTDLMTKYVLADLHMGMFAWAQESGEDYDLKIAEEILISSMETLIASTPPSHTAMILNLGDTFHANDSKNATPGSGHILDMDTRFSKIAIVVVRAIRRCIELAAAKHTKVIYTGVPGNHDKDQAHWLTIALMEAYREHENIEVIYTGSKWFIHQHGMNMIAAHHGDRVPFNRLVLAMADSHSKMWGNTYWRFLDTGHVHHQKEHEIGGVLCRSYRTLAAKDEYASGNAYTSKRSLTAQTLHKTRGEIAVNNIHLFNGKLPN